MSRPTFAHIDLDAVAHNVRAVKSLIGDRKICAAVKADAYGHGAVAVARAMSAAGVDMFGVAMTEEAVELREAGVSKPVVLLTTVPDEDAADLLEHNITACVTEERFAELLSQQAVRRGTTAPVHVNVDTGMRRVGIPHEEAAAAILRVSRLPGLRVTGIFTHFAASDAEDLSVARWQLDLFRRVIGVLEAAGLSIPMLHVANSAATLRLPQARMDCVRPGLILYGLRPRMVPRQQIDVMQKHLAEYQQHPEKLRDSLTN